MLARWRRVEVTGPRGVDGGLRANRFGSVAGRAADGACLVPVPDQPAAVVGLEHLALAQHGLANTKAEAPKAKMKAMEPWEKEKLVRDMDRLDPEKLLTALSIIRKGNKVDLDDVDSDDEVTIDIDALDVRAL